jgi:hypothetical protein
LPPGKRTYEQERQRPYDQIIRDCFPVEEPGISWTNGWKRAHRKGIANKTTYSNYVKTLLRTKLLIAEGRGKRKLYRQNPTLKIPYAEGMRNYMQTYPEITYTFEVPTKTRDEIFTDPELFRQVTGCLFNDIYRLYLTMLNELVKIKSQPAAAELANLFIALEIRQRLKSYALQVWQHRGRMRIVETLGGTTLKQEDSALKWISQRPVKEIVNRWSASDKKARTRV